MEADAPALHLIALPVMLAGPAFWPLATQLHVRACALPSCAAAAKGKSLGSMEEVTHLVAPFKASLGAFILCPPLGGDNANLSSCSLL